MRHSTVRVRVTNIHTGKVFLEDVTMREAADKLEVPLEHISAAKNRGRIIKRTYSVEETAGAERIIKDQVDDYALEWEFRELCRKIREKAGA